MNTQNVIIVVVAVIVLVIIGYLVFTPESDTGGPEVATQGEGEPPQGETDSDQSVY